MGQVSQYPAGHAQSGYVDVQCFPLYSFLLALNKTTIDYFSLDVEGAELAVLKTIPWSKVNIKVRAGSASNTTIFYFHLNSLSIIVCNVLDILIAGSVCRVHSWARRKRCSTKLHGKFRLQSCGYCYSFQQSCKRLHFC